MSVSLTFQNQSERHTLIISALRDREISRLLYYTSTEDGPKGSRNVRETVE